MQQYQPLQPKHIDDLASASDSSNSSPLAPIHNQFNNYHNSTLPQQNTTSVNSNDSQTKVEVPGLKRLRNTAASARFRAKKKRREQILEQEARETREAVNKLENRVTELETENRWLKDLIMDKSGATTRETVKVPEHERKRSEHKDGVGTGGQ